MVRSTTKGERTRQRIVELAAPVFNRQGYVGASLRDLVDATGLEKGGIYNHFGSKELLAVEAYDFAMSRVTGHLARSQEGATDALDRLTRMIRAFGVTARRPAIEGGCPIMNTAIECDDTHPELRDRARASMTLWHRLVGRIALEAGARHVERDDRVQRGVEPLDAIEVQLEQLAARELARTERRRQPGCTPRCDRVVRHRTSPPPP